MIGLLSARPNPFAVAEPIRRPVKEPGPAATAMASTSESSVCVIFTISSSIGKSVCECVFL